MFTCKNRQMWHFQNRITVMTDVKSVYFEHVFSLVGNNQHYMKLNLRGQAVGRESIEKVWVEGQQVRYNEVKEIHTI